MSINLGGIYDRILPTSQNPCWYIGPDGIYYVCACNGYSMFTCPLPSPERDDSRSDEMRRCEDNRGLKYYQNWNEISGLCTSILKRNLGNNSVPWSLDTLALLIHTGIACMLMKKCIYGEGGRVDKNYEPYLQMITIGLKRMGLCLNMDNVAYTCPWTFLKETTPRDILVQLRRLESVKPLIDERVMRAKDTCSHLTTLLGSSDSDPSPMTRRYNRYECIDCSNFVKTHCGKGLDGRSVSDNDTCQLKKAILSYIEYRELLLLWKTHHNATNGCIRFTTSYLWKHLEIDNILAAFTRHIFEFLMVVYGIPNGNDINVRRVVRHLYFFKKLPKKCIVQMRLGNSYDSYDMPSNTSHYSLLIDSQLDKPVAI
jgi:hypothetical protein